MTKEYSKSMIPYRRITKSDNISEAVRVKIGKKCERLNPAELIWNQYDDKKKGGYAAVKSKDFVYNLRQATI